MKKHFLIIIPLLFFTFFISGCKNNTQMTNENTNNSNSNNQGTAQQEKSPTEKPNDANPDNVDPNQNKPSIKDTSCRLYFFNSKELAMYYIDTTIPVEDNAVIKALTKELQNQDYSKDFLTLTDKVQVKSAKLDRDKNLLTVVFSDSYTDHMNLGNSTESGLLSMLLSTYGYNLGVDKVAIYFNDELYTSLRGELPEGYFKVNYDNAKKLAR